MHAKGSTRMEIIERMLMRMYNVNARMFMPVGGKTWCTEVSLHSLRYY